MVFLAALIIAFLLASGLLAMIDAAILSITAAEVEELVNKRLWGATPLKLLIQRQTRAVIVIVILTNTINIIGPIIIGLRANRLFGSDVLGIVTAVLTFGTIVFSEIIPKSIGTHYAPRISRIAAPFVLAVVTILLPIVMLLDWVVKPFKRGDRMIGTEDQIRALVHIGGGAGHIEEDERQLIHRAFRLNDRRASDIMVPRETIIAVPVTATIRDVARLALEQSHTRYPVYGGSLDDIRGFILSRDVMRSMAEGRDDVTVDTLMQEPLIVSSRTRADNLLVLFRDRQVHLAIVKDDHQTIGIVTLKDVMEELVGELIDESEGD